MNQFFKCRTLQHQLGAKEIDDIVPVTYVEYQEFREKAKGLHLLAKDIDNTHALHLSRYILNHIEAKKYKWSLGIIITKDKKDTPFSQARSVYLIIPSYSLSVPREMKLIENTNAFVAGYNHGYNEGFKNCDNSKKKG